MRLFWIVSGSLDTVDPANISITPSSKLPSSMRIQWTDPPTPNGLIVLYDLELSRVEVSNVSYVIKKAVECAIQHKCPEIKNNMNNNNNKLPLLKSTQNAQPTSVAQDSNAKPKMPATRSQTRPVYNSGITQFLTCHPHTDHSFVCSPVARQPPFDRYQVILLGDRGT